MSRTKGKKAESGALTLEGSPTLEGLRVQEVPDFDSVSMAALCSDAQTLSKQAAAVFSKLARTCEEIQKQGVLTAFAKNDLSRRLKQTVEQAQQITPKLPGVLVELTDSIERWRSGESRTRRARFEDIAHQLNWKIVGSWPEPVVEHVVFVVVNEASGRATVNGRQLGGGVSAERIASAVANELRDLEERRTEPSEFIASVWKAFKAGGGSEERGISVFDLLREMVWQSQGKAFHRDPRQELFRGYSVAQFRCDLTNYLSVGAPGVKEGNTEYELEVQGGSFAADGIFIYLPQTHRLATCGRLAFRARGGGER
ncbi:MAG TPA: hypothetical protein VFS77_15375 [Pyrinomonadaceae bacterium]|nr:hypothetical protein [Pyrinomonadaceae bacterium]